MRRQKPQRWRSRPTLFSHWRGYPLYIFYVYLRGQLTFTLPAFLGGVAFNQVITRVAWHEWVGAVAVVVVLVTVGVYAFYHRYSPAIRSLLTALIVGREIDRELATQAWIEAVNYPYVVISRVMLFLTLAYTGQAVYFFLFTEFDPGLVLRGSIISYSTAVAITQAFFVLYLEQMMYPVAQAALAVGAQPDLDDRRVRRFRLHVKLPVLISSIMIAPVMTLGLFSYSQTVQLGGDPTAGLLLTGVIALAASGIAVALALLLARSVLTPVQELERVVAAVADGDLTARAFSCTSDELTGLGLHLNDMAKELEERDRMKTAFGRYVSTAVRDGILSGQISLGGERREVTIVFTDIRDFTTWCECTPPEEVIHTLNAYFDILVKAIAEHDGTITRYTGDGLLALFGAPLDDPDHAYHAVEAVLEAQGYLDSLNEIRRAVEAFELRTGFGIHTGVAVIGSIGCETRAEYTPIGDPANVASRIEGLNKNLGTSILISSDTLERVAERVVTGKTAETPVKGRIEPVRVYEVVGLGPGPGVARPE